MRSSIQMFLKISLVLVACTCTYSGDIPEGVRKLKAIKKLDLSRNPGVGELLGAITSVHLGFDELSLRLQHRNHTASSVCFIIIRPGFPTSNTECTECPY